MRKLIIKDYIGREGLEFNFKINCLTSKSIGGRKEEYPCMYVFICIYTYIFQKKPSKGFKSNSIYKDLLLQVFNSILSIAQKSSEYNYLNSTDRKTDNQRVLGISKFD